MLMVLGIARQHSSLFVRHKVNLELHTLWTHVTDDIFFVFSDDISEYDDNGSWQVESAA